MGEKLHAVFAGDVWDEELFGNMPKCCGEPMVVDGIDGAFLHIKCAKCKGFISFQMVATLKPLYSCVPLENNKDKYILLKG